MKTTMESSKMNNKPAIAFIGLGNMGSRMARRILEAGFPLTVFNRSPKAMESLVAAGAKAAPSAADAARGAAFVCTSVFDDEAVRDIYLKADGAFAGGSAATLFIEMTTISVHASKQMHEEAKKRGFAYLDAPVSGSTPQAESGQLVVLCGGDEGAFKKAKPILDAMGKAAVLLGPGGSGSLTKLCINAMLAMGMQSLAEALALGERGGLDRELLLETIGQTAVVSPGQKAKFPNAIKDQYPSAFPLKLIAKDLRLALAEAKASAVNMPQTASAEAAVTAGLADGANDDFSVLIRQVRDS